MTDQRGGVQFLSTPLMVRGLQGMLEDAGHAGLVEVIDWFFYSPVRNAFAHAAYTLHEDKFRIRSGTFEVGGIRTPELPLTNLSDLFNRALAFYGVFMNEYGEQRGSYRTNKVIRGRISGGSEFEPVELLADAEHGLYGFRSPPGGESGAAAEPEAEQTAVEDSAAAGLVPAGADPEPEPPKDSA